MSPLLLVLITAIRFLSPTFSPEGKQSVISHETWNLLLSKCMIAGGKVNYRAFVAKKTELQSYLEMLQQNPPQTNWSRYEKMAYWINAYNAFTVKLVVDHYPINSIRDLNNGNPWDNEFLSIGDKKYSLNNIENDMLRKQFTDARIHFAVNCASQSCPRLFNQAFTAENVDKQLTQLAKEFINDPAKNKINADKAEVSQIFNWYKDDFTKTGTLADFLNTYSTTKINSTAAISFLEYDWSLNE